MTLIGLCERCVNTNPLHAPNDRQRLQRGPNGRHLCNRHAGEAWNEHWGEA